MKHSQKTIKRFIIKILKFLLPCSIFNTIRNILAKPRLQIIEDKYKHIPLDKLDIAGVTNLLRTYRLADKNRDNRYYNLCNLLERFDFKEEANILRSNEAIDVILKKPWLPDSRPNEVIFDSRIPDIPLVSLIITYYNEGPEVVNYLKKFLKQTLYLQKKCEFIIIDSNSPCNEYVMLKEAFSDYSNILFIKTNYRETLYGAWNRGVSIARAEVINFSSINEFLVDNALELMLEELSKNPDVDWIQADFIWENKTYYINCQSKDYMMSMLLTGGFMTTSAHLLRKNKFIELGGFNQTYKSAGDTDFKMRFSQSYNVKHLAKPLAIEIETNRDTLSNQPRAEIEDYRAWLPYRDIEHIKKLLYTKLTSYEAARYLADIGFTSLYWKNPFSDTYYTDSFFSLKCFKAAKQSGYSNYIILNNIKHLEELTGLYYRLQGERNLQRRLVISVKIYLLRKKLLNSEGRKIADNVVEREYNWWKIW